MENPLNWNEVDEAINDAMQKYWRDLNDGVCGGSIVYYIRTALESKGYLNAK